MTAFLSRGGIPAAAEEISRGLETSLDAGQHIYPGRNNFVWIRVTGGAALLIGLPEMKLEAADVCFPWNQHVAQSPAGPLRLEGLGTQEVAANKAVVPGLSLLRGKLLVEQVGCPLTQRTTKGNSRGSNTEEYCSSASPSLQCKRSYRS